MLELFGAYVLIASPLAFLAYNHPTEFRRLLGVFIAIATVSCFASGAWFMAALYLYSDVLSLVRLERLSDLDALFGRHQTISGSIALVALAMLFTLVPLEMWIANLKGTQEPKP